MSFVLMVRHLQSKPALRHSRLPANPRPPGVIQPGSATAAVLDVLEQQPGKRMTCAELMLATRRSHSAVSFALLFLRRLGLAQCKQGDERNPRYMRYWVPKK